MKIVEAKVIEYNICYHSIFCGIAKIEIVHSGETVEIKTVKHYKVGDIIEVYESEIDIKI